MDPVVPPITVIGGNFNENSGSAVFTVNAAPGQLLSFDVRDVADAGKAPTGDDEGKPDDSLDNAPIYYSLDGGSTWQLYNGTPVAAGNVPVLVAVDVSNERDDVYEGEERFQLVVNPGPKESVGYASLFDDGTGTVTDAPNAPGFNGADNGQPKDDDRPITVVGGNYNENSGSAVFTVKANPGQTLTLNVVDAASSGKAPTGDNEGKPDDSLDLAPIYYSVDGGKTWALYQGPFQAGSQDVLVAVDVANEADDVYEGEEQFKLIVNEGQPTESSGYASLFDDGTGIVANRITDKTTNYAGADNGQPKDDDRGIKVTGGNYNENSGSAVFTVKANPGQTLTLNVVDAASSGKAPTGDNEGKPDDSLDLAPIYYSVDGGKTWALYQGPFQAGSQDVLVAVDVANEADDVFEGEEQFKLIVNEGQPSESSAYASLFDDGTGTVTNRITDKTTNDAGADNGQLKDDDRTIEIPDVTVNENSPYAVFRVFAASNQTFSLSLKDGGTDDATGLARATLGNDYDGQIQTYDGTVWSDYTPGTQVSVPPGGSVLLVRVAIRDDDGAVPNSGEFENAHSFRLLATAPGADPVSGRGIISDFGTGAIFNDSGTEDRLAAKDDDRSIKIDSPIVNEGSDYVVFNVTGQANTRITLGLTTDSPSQPAATIDTSAGNIQFWNGATWAAYDAKQGAVIGADGKLLVRVGITAEQDDLKEGSEVFNLTARSATNPDLTAFGTATIRDDGTGVKYQFAANNGAFTGTNSSGLDDDFDQDGITPTTEEALATLAASQGIGDAVKGDLNNDGKQDAEQNALATLAWTVKEYFEQGNDGTLTESRAIISVSVVDSATNQKVSETSQLLNIQVLKYTDVDPATQVVETPRDNAGATGSGALATPLKTVTLADGVSKVTTPWDPIRFEVTGQDTDNNGTIDTKLTDVDAGRAGTQVRVLIDIRASGLTTKDVDAYIKHVDQAFLDAAAAAGKTVVDLDGKAITKAGWYDFTQRVAGGDGARFIPDADGKIQFIELIITDNAFGDNDFAEQKIYDPGAPVKRVPAPVPEPEPLVAKQYEQPAPLVLPPAPLIEVAPGPQFSYSPFDSTLYALAAAANPKDWGLIERTDWHWEEFQRDAVSLDATRWQPLVVSADSASLQVFRGMGDQFAERGAATSFAVPSDAFVHTQSGAEVTLTAKLADGSDLPAWIVFDAQSGKFSITAPDNYRGELRIKLTARDAQGREASTLFRFHVGDKRQGAGRSALSEQLRDASAQRLAQRAPVRRA